MALAIFITPKASQDLEAISDYIAQNNPDAALRFFDATRQTIAKLAQNPYLGGAYPLSNSRLAGLRKWKVKGFDKYLIFYLIEVELLTIIRIIHVSRDIPTILNEETQD
ncbi:MAG: type II toxin-antitoxin system RelE/ParE family toxin [Cyanobacteria bacterium P01_G01_bin.49]